MINAASDDFTAVIQQRPENTRRINNIQGIYIYTHTHTSLC